MLKLHCDLCDRILSKDENITRVTWEDNNAYDDTGYGIFRKPRKISADICDKCLRLLREKVKLNNEQEEQKITIGMLEDMRDSMIRASNKACLERNMLLDIFYKGENSDNGGLMGVYNLGLQHMYEYLEGK